jgi:hypothetical protein
MLGSALGRHRSGIRDASITPRSGLPSTRPSEWLGPVPAARRTRSSIDRCRDLGAGHSRGGRGGLRVNIWFPHLGSQCPDGSSRRFGRRPEVPLPSEITLTDASGTSPAGRDTLVHCVQGP